MTRHRHRVAAVLLMCAALVVARPAEAQQSREVPASTGVLWQEPRDIETRDLFYGIGAENLRPTGRFRFVEEDSSGTKPKFLIEDGKGVRWTVKLGDEAQPEVAATRLIWAAGYFVDEDYYLPVVTVEGLSNLRRGQHHVADNGTIRDVRFERKPAGKKLGTWHWAKNPFVGTQELNGLRVLMALVNNWDLKASNNAIRSRAGGAPVYYVSDLGSTFGTSRGRLKGNRGDAEGYAQSTFIRRLKDTHVDFELRTCPVVLIALFAPYYAQCRNLEHVVEKIPLAHARRIGDLLGRLSREQIADAFRAAGYTPDEIARHTNTVSTRISALRELEAPRARASEGAAAR